MKAIDFCVFVSCYLTEFFKCSSFIIDSLPGKSYSIISSTTRYSFTSSLSNLMPVIDLFCPIALINLSSIILISSRDREHLCLVPDFSGNASSVSPLRDWL